MPRGDKTGPFGQGPMTGRGLGYCTGNASPGFVNNFFGRGMGRGRGFGRGMGFGFRGGMGTFSSYPTYSELNYTKPSKEEEADMLKIQARNFKQNLEDIEKRIKELEKDNK